MKPPHISPGRITSTWLTIKVAFSRDNLIRSDLILIASQTSLRGGDLPIEDGFELAKICGFIEENDKKIKIKKLGKEIALLSVEYEPTLQVFRKILLRVIVKYLPFWTAFIDRTMEEIIKEIPDNWLEVLEHAELISDTAEVNFWWEELKKNLTKIEEDIRKSTGKAGEKLTLYFEKNRLKKTHLTLSENIKWVARISDNYGHDIQSFFGLFKYYDSIPENELLIEVKSSSSKADDFRFFLTRTEWETALKNPNCYLFYLWRGVDNSQKNVSAEGPFIFPAGFVRDYLPSDTHLRCRWESCRIIINLREEQKKIINLDN
jgi:hypothetical protein